MARGAEGYRVSRRADGDLEEIYVYTRRRWSAAQAERYIRQIEAVFRGLAAGLLTGRASEVGEGMLRIAAGSHVIFYQRGESGVLIVRVLHAVMDAPRHLGGGDAS